MIGIFEVNSVLAEEENTVNPAEENVSSKVNSDHGTESFSIIVSLFASFTGLSGVIGLFWGVYRYKEGQIMKRKEILFELIKNYDKDKSLKFAIQILDDYPITPKSNWTNTEKNYYHKNNLDKILRYHESSPIIDPGEKEIRDSMDYLLQFFGKLGYLMKVGIIKKDEILYFDYMLKQLTQSKDVKNYINKYHFPLYEALLDQLEIKK